MQDLYKRSLGKICLRRFCTSSLQELSWQDLCKKPLRKICVQGPYKRSLGRIFVQALSIRALLARSLYETSWQDISTQGLCTGSLGKICLGDFCTSSLQDLSRQHLWETSWQDFCNRSPRRSLYKISTRGLLARSLYKISMEGLWAFPNNLSRHRLPRSLQKLFIKDLLVKISAQDFLDYQNQHHATPRATIRHAQNFEQLAWGVSKRAPCRNESDLMHRNESDPTRTKLQRTSCARVRFLPNMAFVGHVKNDSF